MKPEQTKSHEAKLSDEDQDAFAQWTLWELKKRGQLEQAAPGSLWKTLGPVFTIIVAVVFLSFRDSLADYLPYILLSLLFLIQRISTCIHSRIDAMVELMKMESRKETSAPKAHSAPSSPS